MIAATRKALIAAAAWSLPDDDVRAALVAAAGGEDAPAAWRHWCDRYPDPLAALRAQRLRTLLPLLDWSLRRHDVAVAPAVRDGLRAAAVAERSRSGRYDAILAGLASILAPHRVLVLKGAALAHLVYPQRSLRHCHDIDLVTTPDARPAIVQALISADFSHAHGALVHSSGLPARIHTRVFATRRYRLEFDNAWNAGRTLEVGDVTFRTLCEADALVHVCAHAASWRGPESARWWPDAALLIRSGRIDWSRVEHLALTSGTAMPVLQRLESLSRYEPIPDTVLVRIRSIVEGLPLAVLATDAVAATLSRLKAGTSATV